MKVMATLDEVAPLIDQLHVVPAHRVRVGAEARHSEQSRTVAHFFCSPMTDKTLTDWSIRPLPAQVAAIKQHLSGAGSLRVIESCFLPYESTDPKKPGMVHAVMIDGALVVSRECFQELRRHAKEP